MEYQLEELLPVVAWLSDKYTSKESSSIPYEIAEQLMGAVLYCLEEHTQSVSSSYSPLNLQNNHSMDVCALYDSGYTAVLQKTEHARACYNMLTQTFCSYHNIALEDTILHGMPSFFLYYDARFYPQNHILTLDYPLLHPLSNLCGINLIDAYLKCIQLEQSFLLKLPTSYVTQVLLHFHSDYANLFVNLCQIVLRHILKCHLIEIPISTVNFSSQDQLRCQNIITTLSVDELKDKLDCFLHKIINCFYAGNAELYSYLAFDLNDYSAVLHLLSEHLPE